MPVQVYPAPDAGSPALAIEHKGQKTVDRPAKTACVWIRLTQNVLIV